VLVQLIVDRKYRSSIARLLQGKFKSFDEYSIDLSVKFVGFDLALAQPVAEQRIAVVLAKSIM
jgi:hypothetical protein